MYQLAQAEAWTEGLRLVHQHPEEAASDPPVRQAVQTFADAFFASLDEAIHTAEEADCLEKWLLLHHGGFWTLDSARFEQSVAALVEWHVQSDALNAARQAARFAPEVPVCAAVLADYDVDEPAFQRTVLDHPQAERIEVSVNQSAPGVDHAASLFRSPQENAFFRALREAFPTYTPYPNVALSSLLDFDALRDDLSASERAFFFKGIVDCVLFDPQVDYRPVYFFELDSAHHDDPSQQQNDRYKDRILARAGQRLYRIRPQAGGIAQSDFVQLLRSIIDPRPVTAHP